MMRSRSTGHRIGSCRVRAAPLGVRDSRPAGGQGRGWRQALPAVVAGLAGLWPLGACGQIGGAAVQPTSATQPATQPATEPASTEMQRLTSLVEARGPDRAAAESVLRLEKMGGTIVNVELDM